MELTGRYLRIQRIYENEGLLSTEFYLQIINYIKYLLAKNLKTYKYTEDQTNDCYIEIMTRVTNHYDPNRGSLGNFINAVVRNYTSKFKYHAKPKEYKEPKSKEKYQIEIVSLDFEVGETVVDDEPREIREPEELKQVLRDLDRLFIDDESIDNLFNDDLKGGYENNAFYRMVLWEMMSK